MQVTKTIKSFTVSILFTAHNNITFAEKLIFEVQNNNHERLLVVEMNSLRGVGLFLDCFDMSPKALIEYIKRLQQAHKVIKISGKVGDTEEQLEDKPEAHDKYVILANMFTHFEANEIWQMIHASGFHELLPR